MTITLTLPLFGQADVGPEIDALSPDALDRLSFGVIGFDRDTNVRVYNATESRLAGLRRESVVDRPLFRVVAPCMNNFMVAQRFDDAAATNAPLDAIVDYVLTLKMRPLPVRLRLIAVPGAALRYVLVDRDD